MATTPLQTIDTHHSSNIHDAQLDYYGKKLATASSDCKINIFEVVGDTQHNQLDSLSGHAGPVWQVGWAHPKFGVLLASCSYDKSVIIHRESPPGTWSPVHKHELHTSSVNRSVCSRYCGSRWGGVSHSIHTSRTRDAAGLEGASGSSS